MPGLDFIPTGLALTIPSIMSVSWSPALRTTTSASNREDRLAAVETRIGQSVAQAVAKAGHVRIVPGHAPVAHRGRVDRAHGLRAIGQSVEMGDHRLLERIGIRLFRREVQFACDRRRRRTDDELRARCWGEKLTASTILVHAPQAVERGIGGVVGTERPRAASRTMLGHRHSRQCESIRPTAIHG
jgi:hypothetical protein